MAKNAAARVKKQERIEPVQQPLGQTFLKQWRENRTGQNGRKLTQTELANDVGVSTATVSEIENGNTGYHQAYLEAVSRRLDVHICDLLCRDPSEGDGIWTLWDRATPKQRQHIVGMVRGYLDSEING